MNKDYSILLENLLARRYDETLRMPIVSDAFKDQDYADSIKYALESMEEIDSSYSHKTFHLAKQVQKRIEQEFYKRKIPIAIRYQGSIQTETHIFLYSGIELLILPYINSNTPPWKAISQTASELMDVLTGGDFAEVNFDSKHKISLIMQQPKCQVTVIPALWINNAKYQETRREIDRGICEYNLENKTRRKYLPFLNIARINSKDDRIHGGLKRAARLLRSLQVDAKDPIALNNYEICSMLYAIPDEGLLYDPQKGLNLLPAISSQLKKIATNKSYREQLVSPSEKELVFGQSSMKLQGVQKLHKELEDLISDIKAELKKTNKKLTSEIPYHS